MRLSSSCQVNVLSMSHYTPEKEIWTGKMWDLDRQTHFLVNFRNKLCWRNIYRISGILAIGFSDCNSIIGDYIRPRRRRFKCKLV